MKNEFDAVLGNKTGFLFKRQWKLWILRIVLFPIWIVVLIKNEVQDSWYRNTQWSESKADHIINKTVPEKLEVCDDELCYCLEWTEPWTHSIRLHFGDKIFGRKFSHEIKKYFEEDFQVDGYKKRLDSPSLFEHWVIFSKL